MRRREGSRKDRKSQEVVVMRHRERRDRGQGSRKTESRKELGRAGDGGRPGRPDQTGSPVREEIKGRESCTDSLQVLGVGKGWTVCGKDE